MDLKVAVAAKKRKCKMKRRKKNKNIIKLLGKQTLKEVTMKRKSRKTKSVPIIIIIINSLY